MTGKYKEYAFMFKALSDPNRLLILKYLQDGEQCACIILDRLQITQSTLSYHMKMLTDCGIVNARKDGKWMHYSLNKDMLKKMMHILDAFLSKS